MPARNVVAIFDFDKTLVSRDSFLIFSLYASESRADKLMAIVFALLCNRGWLTNSQYKLLILNRVWKNKSAMARGATLSRLYARLHELVRRPVMFQLQKHISQGAHVVVISASPDFYLEPFLNSYNSNIRVFGSMVDLGKSPTLLNNLYVRQRRTSPGACCKNSSPGKACSIRTASPISH